MNYRPGDVVKSTTGLFRGERRVLHVYARGWLLLDGAGLCERIVRVEYVQVVPQLLTLERRVWSLAVRDMPRHAGARMELARRGVLQPKPARRAFDPVRQERIVRTVAAGAMAIILPGQRGYVEPERRFDEYTTKTQQRIIESDARVALRATLKDALRRGETRESFMQKLIDVGASRGIAPEAIIERAEHYATGL